MTVKNDLIMVKTQSLLDSIDKMTDNEKSKLASEDYGNEVNKLLALAREENPDKAEYFPTDLEITEMAVGGFKVSTPWSEIHSKLLTLNNMLV